MEELDIRVIFKTKDVMVYPNEIAHPALSGSDLDFGFNGLSGVKT